MKVNQKLFGEWNGQQVYEYTIKNNNGMEIACLNYGCIITKISTPDRNGNLENIVLAVDTVEEYATNSPYFGAVVGRVAGRIKGAEFELDGKTYTLAQNDNQNHLHGGRQGFSHVLWEAKMIEKDESAGMEFTYTSPDGEEGYPGTVHIKVTYLLTNDNELQIHYEGETDQTTLLNLTNHTYFNLSGNLQRDILQHVLKIDSSQFAELTDQLLPTGKLLDVTDTVFDFREGRQIIDGTRSSHSQNKLAGGGYDHPFLLNSHHNEEIMLWEEESGRTLVIETDEPGVVLYTSNQLSEDMRISGGTAKPYLGICLETQGMPDAIHHPSFPSFILNKGDKYSSVTKYSFGVK